MLSQTGFPYCASLAANSEFVRRATPTPPASPNAMSPGATPRRRRCRCARLTETPLQARPRRSARSMPSAIGAMGRRQRASPRSSSAHMHSRHGRVAAVMLLGLSVDPPCRTPVGQRGADAFGPLAMEYWPIGASARRDLDLEWRRFTDYAGRRHEQARLVVDETQPLTWCEVCLMRLGRCAIDLVAIWYARRLCCAYARMTRRPSPSEDETPAGTRAVWRPRSHVGPFDHEQLIIPSLSATGVGRESLARTARELEASYSADRGVSGTTTRDACGPRLDDSRQQRSHSTRPHESTRCRRTAERV